MIDQQISLCWSLAILIDEHQFRKSLIEAGKLSNVGQHDLCMHRLDLLNLMPAQTKRMYASLLLHA